MGARESNRERKQFAAAGPAAVRDAIAGALEFANAAGLTEAAGAKLAIIVEELVANLFEHGGLAAEDKADLELIKEAGGVRLVVEAPGKDFHPGAPLTDTAIPKRGGGAGLRLVQAWSATIDHKRVGDRNRWTLMLSL
jgi:serine/threonine-protein kinase RsbW